MRKKSTGEKLYEERAKRSPQQDDSHYPFGLLGILPLMNRIYFPQKKRRPKLVGKKAA